MIRFPDALIPDMFDHASTNLPCGIGTQPTGSSGQAVVIQRANTSGTVVVTTHHRPEASVSLCQWQRAGCRFLRDAFYAAAR